MNFEETDLWKSSSCGYPYKCTKELSVTYKINILDNANMDLNWFRKNDKSSYIKLFDLTRELIINPRQGTGKPERLKYFEKEVYSRRINQTLHSRC